MDTDISTATDRLDDAIDAYVTAHDTSEKLLEAGLGFPEEMDNRPKVWAALDELAEASAALSQLHLERTAEQGAHRRGAGARRRRDRGVRTRCGGGRATPASRRDNGGGELDA
jgi:hypothetical protein